MAVKADFEKRLKGFPLKVSLELGDECAGLLGESGCGKSMTLKCLAGIETPDRGMIEIDGRLVFHSAKRINVPPRKRRVGYLFQSYALFPNMTVEKNIKSAMADKGESPAQYIEKFRLQGLERQVPATLSGGQKQRTALARMLAAKPQVILLDEPFSALDSSLRWEMEQEVMALLEGFRGTSIVVSHSRDELFRLCGRVGVMGQGSLDAMEEKHRLFENPETGYAAALTGCKNISPARWLDDGHVFAEDWGIALAVAGPVPREVAFVGIRAHHLSFAEQAGENVFPCRVVRRIENVFEDIYLAELGGKPLRLEVEKGLTGPKELVHIPRGRIMLLRR